MTVLQEDLTHSSEGASIQCSSLAEPEDGDLLEAALAGHAQRCLEMLGQSGFRGTNMKDSARRTALHHANLL